ncbi:hypothetical protein E4U43_007476, partial [Claviceps pusilla]
AVLSTLMFAAYCNGAWCIVIIPSHTIMTYMYASDQNWWLRPLEMMYSIVVKMVIFTTEAK